MGVKHPALRFWGTSAAVAAGVASFAVLVLPEELGTRGWLLTVWTVGVMCILFGAAALIGAGVGVREVVEAGSAPDAVNAERRVRSVGGATFYGDVGWWTVATGGVLVAIYFIGWLISR
jgi:hypothetical protein